MPLEDEDHTADLWEDPSQGGALGSGVGTGAGGIIGEMLYLFEAAPLVACCEETNKASHKT